MCVYIYSVKIEKNTTVLFHPIKAESSAFYLYIYILNPDCFNIKQPMSSAVRNAVYCIICQGCGQQYTGETKHLRASCARYKDPMFTIMPFYKCRTEDRIFREKSRTIL